MTHNLKNQSMATDWGILGVSLDGPIDARHPFGLHKTIYDRLML